MTGLRVMTFNVKMPPPPAPQHDEAPARARRVRDALLALAPHERPDVIAFNEVMHPKARRILVRGLGGFWPNFLSKLDDGSLGDDSGLAIFSRLPFLDLPLASGVPGTLYGGKVAFEAFDAGNIPDALANKGVGVALVDAPMGPVAVAFTHMQASYDDDLLQRIQVDPRAIRADQIGTIERHLRTVFGPNRLAWPHMVLVGDLNIVGNPPPGGPEWAAHFGTPGAFLTDAFVDGWAEFMRPPTAPAPLDPGLTNTSEEGSAFQRLDYVCVGRRFEGPALVAQHMRVRLRGLSDHWSVEADLNLRADHCTPSTAVEALAAPAPASHVRTFALTIQRPRGQQWLHVPEPGTFSLFASPKGILEVARFDPENLSDAQPPAGRTDAREFPDPTVRNFLDEVGLPPAGTRLASHRPFFIRLRADPVAAPDFTGPVHVGLLRHNGASRAEAIDLLPWAEPADPRLPAGQALGNEDLCWFCAVLRPARSGKPYASAFELRNATGGGARLELRDEADAELAATDGAGDLTLQHVAPGGRTLYLVLRRDDLGQTDFRISWRPAIAFLRSGRGLPEPGVPGSQFPALALFCEDETGFDAVGDDEIALALHADGDAAPFFARRWNDADTGEVLPLTGAVEEVGFVEGVRIRIDEDDLIAGNPAEATIAPPAGTEDEARRIVLPVQTGRYRFEATVSRR